MKRRNFLKIVGGGMIVAGGAGAAFTMTRRPDAALAPWSNAGGPAYTDPRLRALSHAILAPNPHNRQPWIVEMNGADGVTLFFDTDRRLPETDPFDRQLTIGLGCFLELMTMAANAEGYAVETTLFPQGSNETRLDRRPVARARFSRSGATSADPLWLHVPDRRSTKEPFDTSRPVTNAQLARLIATGAHGTNFGGSIDEAETLWLRRLTEDALVIEMETPNTMKESVDLFRIGKAEINANPDGLDFSGAFFEAARLTGFFTRESAADMTSTSFRQGIEMVTASARTSMGHVWIATQNNKRADQIAVGRDWLRLNLAITREGLAVQPMSQALQEYPEMTALFEELQGRLVPYGGTVQMLGRIGYGPKVDVSPRWPLEAKLRNA